MTADRRQLRTERFVARNMAGTRERVLTVAQLAAIVNARPLCCPFHDDSCDPAREGMGTDHCCEDCPHTTE